MLIKMVDSLSLCSLLLGHYVYPILARQTTSTHDFTAQPGTTETSATPLPISVYPLSRNDPFWLLIPPSEPVCCLIPLPPTRPDPDPADELLPFEEWKEKQLALSSTETRTTDHHTPTIIASLSDEPTPASEPTTGILVPVIDTTGGPEIITVPDFFPTEGRFNYASMECSARVHSAGKSMKSASSILSSKKDKYMLAPCSAKNKDIIVELCDDIRVDTVQLANFEFFSGVFKDIAIFLARANNPHSHRLSWVPAGVFRAKNVRGVQTFRLYDLPFTFYRYIRIEFRSHYGKEYFCPVSLLRVYGLTQMEDWRIEEWKQEWQARRPVELTISDEPGHATPIPNEPSAEEPVRYDHQEGEGTSAETSHKTDTSMNTLASHETNHTASSNSTLQTNDSGSITRNSSLEDRNPTHPNVTGRAHPLNSSNDSTDDAKIAPPDANAKASNPKGSKPKAPGPVSTASPVLRATHVATPMPSTGGESIYRTIWNRLDMLERNSTLSLRYVEEQNQSVRQALRRLEEEVGRLRALTNREQQDLQRSMRSVQQKQVEMENRYEILLEQINTLAEEVILEKRLGIAQLCLLTTVLVFMALTRGSRAETHLLSGMRRRVDSGLGLGRGFHPRYRAQSRPSTSERPFSWTRQDRRSTGDISHQTAGGSPRTPVRSGSPPRAFGTLSVNSDRSPSRMEPRSPSKQPTKGVHFPQGLLPFPSLRPGNANGVRRSQSMSLSSDQLVISPGVGKRPATGMKRLARTAHLHEVELDTQRRLRLQAERAEKDNDIDYQNHDTEYEPGASSTLDSPQHGETHRTSDSHFFVEASTPARKNSATGLGRRSPPSPTQLPDNGTEWEDTDADLDADDSMQELVVEEHMAAPRVPRLFSPPTPRTWGARRKARGFSVDTGSAIRMQCS
ncbi:UNC-like C-terminal-domain-containing protein [Rhizoctonia solani]|nr:UNC-like C-terminal-domain-containing protein [Rhizoctonia solani]